MRFECDEQFASMHYFTRHVHEPEAKRIPCSFCDRAFTAERGPNIHVEKVHNRTRPLPFVYDCKECYLQFKDAKTLKRHFCSPSSESLSADQVKPVRITASKPIPIRQDAVRNAYHHEQRIRSVPFVRNSSHNPLI
jgi:hypothetical protein